MRLCFELEFWHTHTREIDIEYPFAYAESNCFSKNKEINKINEKKKHTHTRNVRLHFCWRCSILYLSLVLSRLKSVIANVKFDTENSN